MTTNISYLEYIAKVDLVFNPAVSVVDDKYIKTCCFFIKDTSLTPIKSDTSRLILNDSVSNVVESVTDPLLFDGFMLEDLDLDTQGLIEVLRDNFFEAGGKYLCFLIIPNEVTHIVSSKTVEKLNKQAYTLVYDNSVLDFFTNLAPPNNNNFYPLQGYRGGYVFFSKMEEMNLLPKTCLFYIENHLTPPDMQEQIGNIMGQIFNFDMTGDDFFVQTNMLNDFVSSEKTEESVVNTYTQADELRNNFISFLMKKRDNNSITTLTIANLTFFTGANKDGINVALNGNNWWLEEKVRLEIQISVANFIEANSPRYNALSVDQQNTEDGESNVLKTIQGIILQEIKKYQDAGVLKKDEFVNIPDQTENDRVIGVIRDVEFSFSPIPIITGFKAEGGI